jgi:FkbH-like protein
MEVGSRTSLLCAFAPVELTTGANGTLRIGEQGAINFGTIIGAAKSVTIGSRVFIGPYCIIADTELAEPDEKAGIIADPVDIGDGVWLASRVTVLPGARIGAGAVIAAGSVVSGEIPPGVIAAGNPARVVRQVGPDGAAHSATRAADNHSNGAGAPLPAPHAGSQNGRATSPIAERAAAVHTGLLVADFTIDELALRLESDAAAPRLSAIVAPFDQVMPTLMSAKDPKHDYVVVWTRPEAALPSFARLLDFEQVDEATLLSDVDQFASLLLGSLQQYRFAFIPTWTVPPWRHGLGLVDGRVNGLTRALCAANLRLMARLEEAPNIFVLDAQRWCDNAGRGAHSAKLWYMGKVPFHGNVFDEAARDLKAAIQGLTGMARKLVVVDLDDTLWGGVVGDLGWEQLRLGGHDSLGEAFVDFQRALRSLKRRGVLLAVVSKNDEAVALEAIRKHPEMVLKEADFVGWRINWTDKAANIADLAASLNLGLQSVVFIDDNPFERARVRETLPEVFVPEWPEDKLAYAPALQSLRCFESPTRSVEDAGRTEMYAAEREREKLRGNVGSLDDWLLSLGLRVRVEALTNATLTRTTQLLNKTNQLNLSTRRLTEPELLDWSRAEGHSLWTLTVSDRLGDAGLTGIISLQREGLVGRIVDFVLSCRVMGRRVEETMVYLAVDAARRMSLTQVVAELVPTAKNRPCLEFWQRSGFHAETPTLFTWSGHDEYPLPHAISLERVA